MRKVINVSPILPSGERGNSKFIIESREEEEERESQPNVYERLQIAGVNLARLEGEKRGLAQQLKVMAEDRDHYRKLAGMRVCADASCEECRAGEPCR